MQFTYAMHAFYAIYICKKHQVVLIKYILLRENKQIDTLSRYLYNLCLNIIISLCSIGPMHVYKYIKVLMQNFDRSFNKNVWWKITHPQLDRVIFDLNARVATVLVLALDSGKPSNRHRHWAKRLWKPMNTLTYFKIYVLKSQRTSPTSFKGRPHRLMCYLAVSIHS